MHTTCRLMDSMGRVSGGSREGYSIGSTGVKNRNTCQARGYLHPLEVMRASGRNVTFDVNKHDRSDICSLA